MNTRLQHKCSQPQHPQHTPGHLSHRRCQPPAAAASRHLPPLPAAGYRRLAPPPSSRLVGLFVDLVDVMASGGGYSHPVH
ncbi:hypothetical protein HanIR_Chr10g0461851 [Helianthus annuus]|nr:hypothetical protein HanIR_Chr10g0461851 [Helianthus annuus]